MKLLIIFAISAVLLKYHFAASAPGGEGSASKIESRELLTIPTVPLPDSNAEADERNIRFSAKSKLPKYELAERLGRGSFGMVFSAKHLLTDVKVAIKAIEKSKLSKRFKKRLFEEPNNMKGLDHPNIVKLFHIIDTEKYLYLVLENVSDGDVFHYLREHGKMLEEDARDYFRQMILALQYLHRNNIVHRDLKSNNFLLDTSKNCIKIADFGLSTHFTGDIEPDSFKGNRYFAAPEVSRGEKYDGPKADVWSLGITLHLMMDRSYPFEGDNYDEVLDRIDEGYLAPRYASNECKDFLHKLLNVDPIKRYSVQQIMEDPWINIKPYVEPELNSSDQAQIKKSLEKHYKNTTLIEHAIAQADYYDDVFAAYLMLGGKCPKAHESESSGGSTQHGPVGSNASNKRPATSGNSPPHKKTQTDTQH